MDEAFKSIIRRGKGQTSVPISGVGSTEEPLSRIADVLGYLKS